MGIRRRTTCEQCGHSLSAVQIKRGMRFCGKECVRVARQIGRIEPLPWTVEDIHYLESLDDLTAREAGEEIGRGMQAVQHMRRNLRLGKVKVREFWTNDEIAIVRKTPHFSAQQVAEKLPNRTVSSVNQMRARLAQVEGIDFSVSPNPHDVGARRLLARTCLGCGLLLDASWFSRRNDEKRRGGRKWAVRCIRCERIDAPPDRTRTVADRQKDRSRYKLLQSITRDKATRHGYAWVQSDHEILRDTTMSNFEKAIKLGRTLSSVSTMVHVNGYSSRVGKGDPLKGVWRIDNPNEMQYGATG